MDKLGVTIAAEIGRASRQKFAALEAEVGAALELFEIRAEKMRAKILELESENEWLRGRLAKRTGRIGYLTREEAQAARRKTWRESKRRAREKEAA